MSGLNFFFYVSAYPESPTHATVSSLVMYIKLRLLMQNADFLII